MQSLFDELDKSPTLGQLRERCDPCARKHGGNPQSVKAWTKARKTVTTQRQRILAALTVRVGDVTKSRRMTCEEIAVVLKTTPNRISGRFRPMQRAGLIQWAGERTTERGTTADLWELTLTGLEVAKKLECE
jgi:predicted ArsR family transcriptional regulator